MNGLMVYLASQSPRRKKIFEILGCPFRVIAPRDVLEDKNPLLPESDIVLKNARAKARSVLEDESSGLIIGADTEVFLDGKVFGKPRDREDAVRMLRLLSGRTHKVLTGVSVIDVDRGKEEASFYDTSLVTFKKLDEDAVKSYMEKNDVMDKAGAYAVQNSPETIISSVKGSLWNVIGFPVERFAEYMKKNQPGCIFHVPDRIPDALFNE